MADRQTRAGNATWVIEQLRELGLNPHPSSRPMRMCRVVNRGFVPYEDRDFPVALESMRDMQHLGFVLGQLHTQRVNPDFQAIVKRVIKDSALPQQDLNESPGRDKQFELYLAANCQNAGMLPVDCAEPDVTCVAGGIKFCIAAKRLKSFKSLKDHIRKAATQIANRKQPGVIALDLSLAWNRKNAPVLSQLHGQLLPTIMQARARQFYDEHRQDIHRLVAGCSVLAVVSFDFAIRLLPDGESWEHVGMMSWEKIAHDRTQAECELDTFYDAFVKGVPNLQDCESSTSAQYS
ncbi:MAG: hypothetical protein KF777_23145 [Planctomycetaceae bacterium]|nr:hypothetical protein [Planctomycetaceae bacterium]